VRRKGAGKFRFITEFREVLPGTLGAGAFAASGQHLLEHLPHAETRRARSTTGSHCLADSWPVLLPGAAQPPSGGAGLRGLRVSAWGDGSSAVPL